MTPSSPPTAADCSSISQHPPSLASLPLLPAEIIYAILALVEARDLANLSQTCRSLNVYASSDRLWRTHVQANVPGCTVASPGPCASFRELYAAHELHWFLPRFKIWFSGSDMAGRLVLARYDPRRGCIEGHQLLAVNRGTTQTPWPLQPSTVAEAFVPDVHLHRDRPVLHIDVPRHQDSPGGFPPASRRFGPIPMDIDDRLHQEFLYACPAAQFPTLDSDSSPSSSSSSSSSQRAATQDNAPAPTQLPEVLPPFGPQLPGTLATPMPVGIFSNLHDWYVSDANFSDGGGAQTAQERPPFRTLPRDIHRFPFYRNWPTPAVPSSHRVLAVRTFNEEEETDIYPRGPAGFPSRRADISDRAFYRLTKLGLQNTYDLSLRPQAATHAHAHSHVPSMAHGSKLAGPAVHNIEQFETFATIDPHYYTPTADKPYRGIWVGDYNAHGCEFLLMHQPDDDDDDDDNDDNYCEAAQAGPVTRFDDETDAAYVARVQAARSHRGRLEAIKLTGDPNVPRGEISFVVRDLRGAPHPWPGGPFAGPFADGRVVDCFGHVAGSGFQSDTYIKARLLLLSTDRMALHWIGLRHVSFFERVDLDKFLAV